VHNATGVSAAAFDDPALKLPDRRMTRAGIRFATEPRAMSYVEAMAVSASVCGKVFLAFLLLRKTALVLSLRSVSRSRFSARALPS
jgi:hypothetical protein